MLTEKYYTNFYAPDNADSMEDSGGLTPVGSSGPTHVVPDEPSEPETLAPGTVVIEEQPVTTEVEDGELFAFAIISGTIVNAEKLLVNFDGKDYLVPRGIVFEEETFYGEATVDGLSFENFPFILNVYSTTEWLLCTPEPGTYTISAKIPDGKGIPKIIKMGKPNTIVNQVEEIIKSLGGTVDTKRRNLQNLISTLADMAENGEIGGKTEVKNIRGTYTWSNLNSMNGLSVTRRSDVSLAFADVPDDYQASENKIVVWGTNVSPINVVWSNLQLSDLSISTIAVANPTTNSAEFDQLTVTCTIYYW